jgi:hypothetical protein
MKISKIKNIIKNIFAPARHRFIYQKKNGEQGIYIITNSTALKGCDSTSFSNSESRANGIYKIGFKAKVLNRGGRVRSFHYARVREMKKLSIFEEVIA